MDCRRTEQRHDVQHDHGSEHRRDHEQRVGTPPQQRRARRRPPAAARPVSTSRRRGEPPRRSRSAPAGPPAPSPATPAAGGSGRAWLGPQLPQDVPQHLCSVENPAATRIGPKYEAWPGRSAEATPAPGPRRPTAARPTLGARGSRPHRRRPRSRGDMRCHVRCSVGVGSPPGAPGASSAAWLAISLLVLAASAAFGQDLEDTFSAPGVDSQKATELMARGGSDQAG